MTRFALITTTIHDPKVLHQYAGQGLGEDDVIIVAGDHKTPHVATVHTLDNITRFYGVKTRYLHPSVQSDNRSSSIIGWNCIQRRNIALLEALKYQPQYVTTVDDDNHPSHDYFNKIVENMSLLPPSSLSSNDGWYNVGEKCRPKVFHRGYPREFKDADWFPHVVSQRKRVGVLASLWTGAPDIDAVERAHWDPEVTHIESYNTTLVEGTWCPFNSQATTYAGELAPIMYMWPGVGRYDDIWCSFLARAIMDHLNWAVVYGNPTVHQERNPHNVVADIRAELFGMEHNMKIIEILRKIQFTQTTPIECFAEAVDHLDSYALFLPTQTIEGLTAWVTDVRKALT